VSELVLSRLWGWAIVSLVACASTSGTRPSETAGPVRVEPAHLEHAGASESTAQEPVLEPEGHAPEEKLPAEVPTATNEHDSGGHTTPRDGGAAAASAQVAYEKAGPIFAAHCASCHTSHGSKSSKNALKHFDMDSYPFGGHHADEVTASIRKVLGADGSKPTMPRDRPGAVQGEELSLILAWADAYDRAHSTGAHEHDHHH